MGSAVSLKSNIENRDAGRGLPSVRWSERGSERDPVPNLILPRSHTPSHGTTIDLSGNQDETPQMVPLTHHGLLSVSSIPSSISSLERASPMVTPSPGRATPMDTATQRGGASSVDRGRSRGDFSSAASGSGSTNDPHHFGREEYARPSSSSGIQGMRDGVPRMEEMAVMAAALMKPYHTMCRKLVNTDGSSSSSRKTCASSSSPLAARAVERLARLEEVDGDGRFPQLRTELWAGSPCVHAFLFSNPPPEASEVVAATYPARWFPSITPCFEEGLLYRIEWRRRSQHKLPDETGGYAHVVWCYHNSTACYSMEIEVTFEVPADCGTVAPLRGWGETTVSWPGEKTTGAVGRFSSGAPDHPWLIARVVCPPLSTVGFVMGRVGAFQSSIRGVPVPPSPPEALRATFISARELDEKHQSLSSEEGLRLALKEWRRFVDPEFPPYTASLSGGTAKEASLLPGGVSAAASTSFPTAVKWLRTSDIVARLVGPSCVPLTRMHQPLTPIIDPIYIEPGELGDSWLIGAMAVVAEHPVILLRMFRHPESTENAKIERVIGAFRVTLNVQGWWRSVVVDDFLPVTEGNYPKYAHSRRDVRELWMGLLEKAFAKLRGGYARIVAGDPLDALRVLTGWPCARYDIANFKDIAVVSSAFASRMLRYNRHGLQIIFHTAPQLSGSQPGRVADPASCTIDEDYASGGNGLAPGMVYAVLQILQFSTNPFRAELTLLQVRNIWGDVAAWRGKWRCGSHRWAQWPKVAEACRMPIHPTHELTDEDVAEDEKAAAMGTATQRVGTGSSNSAPSQCTCRRDKYIWMEWSEVYRYFSGCGVMFRLALHHEYRVQGVFEGVRPSVCLRVTVTSRSFVGLTLSMQSTVDEAGEEEATRMDNGGAASAHPPIMISLAREEANVLYVVRNSQLDPDNPTPLFTFMQVSDISLLSLLTPEDSPYWVIPRMLATAPSPSSSASSVDAAAAMTSAVKRHSYVLGYFQKDAAGLKDGSRVEFMQLDAASPAFQNSTYFSLGDGAKSVKAKFQVKSPQAGFPRTYIHTEVSEEAGTPADDDFNAAAACL